jgi:hypothetical protein
MPAERDYITVDAGTVVVQRPVAMYIMLDQSGSMAQAGSTTSNTKWSVVVDGITTFVNDTRSAGLDVALGFFPPLFGSSVAKNANMCDGLNYQTPEVPMGTLPGNASAITSKLSNQAPTGLGTPTEGALRGAMTFCENYQQAHPDEDCVVVFATDGQPSTCDTNLTDLAKIVSDANAQGVKTFAIGMASQNPADVDFNFLNSVAIAGGTNCNPGTTGKEACNVGGGSDMSTALNTIRQTVTKHETKTLVKQSTLACEFKVPNTNFDPQKVNISFQNSSGAKETILNVPTANDCGRTSSKGWYYEYGGSDPTVPTKMLLCPSTCTDINGGAMDGGFLSVSSAGNAPAINVQIGCKTEIAIIQ